MEKFLDIFPGKKTVFIAEIGINHNGDFDTARRMIMAASKAGADAVKFQTFVPEQMYSPYTNSLMKWGEEREADCEQINFFKKFVLSQDQYR